MPVPAAPAPEICQTFAHFNGIPTGMNSPARNPSLPHTRHRAELPLSGLRLNATITEQHETYR